MSREKYERIIEDLCARNKVPVDPNTYLKLDVAVDGTLFSLIPASGVSGEDIDAIGYIGDMGPLPEEDREDVALHLLETNLFAMGRDTPVFALNPESGHALITGTIPVAPVINGIEIPVTGDIVLKVLAAMAAVASEWRASHFMGEDILPLAGPTSNTADFLRTSQFK